MTYTKTISKQIVYVGAFLLAAVLISWNDTKNLRKENSRGTGTNGQYAELKYFPVLRISKADMEKLFKKQPGNPKVYKLVFKFNINNLPDVLNPSLTAFQAKRGRRKYIPSPSSASPDPKITLERTTKTCEQKGEYTMGNLEISRKYWEETVLPKGKDSSYLYFFPKQQEDDGLYSIVYLLYWGTDKIPDKECLKPGRKDLILTADGELNPSPPADPR